MFGKDSGLNGSPSHNNGMDYTSADCLRIADAAYESGELSQALHLYIIAFEKASQNSAVPDTAIVDGLRKAWDLACRLKERSLAEYIFEKLEPYSSSEEAAHHAEQLQRMALDKLEEFGLSREDIQEMADMISEDFLGMGGIMQFASGSVLPYPIAALRDGSSSKEVEAEADAAPMQDDSEADASAPVHSVSDVGSTTVPSPSFKYADLVGYDRAIEQMHRRGIGLAEDKRFNEFLSMLSRRHGIESAPSVDTLVFRAYAREDANQLMAATVGELDLPAVRMYMEETPQGVPVLCVMASPDFKSRVRLSRTGFEGSGVLILENIDVWGSPLSGALDEFDVASFAQLSRGAREAITLIRSAVENPEFKVMATCSTDRELDEFFIDMLEPIEMIDVDVPNKAERAAVWDHVAQMYPSLRFLDCAELVHLSAHMSRYDIYMAAREAVEQAYRMSVERRVYVPVTRENLLDKVAAYQPLDSGEYRELEDAAVRSFRADLDNLEDLLKGSAE